MARKIRIDDLDLQILRCLQRDARRSFREIAKELEVAAGTVQARIRRMQEAGIIKGYTVLVDPAKLGYSLTALTLIQADGRYLVEVEREIAKYKNVCCVYDITGEFDIAVVARFRDRDSMNKFIKSILAHPHVKRTVTNVVLNVVEEDLRVKL